MPLTKKGRTIMRSMSSEYGPKKGKSVFYASKNKGRISGVDCRARVRDFKIAVRDAVIKGATPSGAIGMVVSGNARKATRSGDTRAEIRDRLKSGMAVRDAIASVASTNGSSEASPFASGKYDEGEASMKATRSAATRTSFGSRGSPTGAPGDARFGHYVRRAAPPAHDDNEIGKFIPGNPGGPQPGDSRSTIDRYIRANSKDARHVIGRFVNRDAGTRRQVRDYNDLPAREQHHQNMATNMANLAREHPQHAPVAKQLRQHHMNAAWAFKEGNREKGDHHANLASALHNRHPGLGVNADIKPSVRDVGKFIPGNPGGPAPPPVDDRRTRDAAGVPLRTPAKFGWHSEPGGTFNYPTHTHPAHPGHKLEQGAGQRWQHVSHERVEARGMGEQSMHTHLQRFHAAVRQAAPPSHDRRTQIRDFKIAMRDKLAGGFNPKDALGMVVSDADGGAGDLQGAPHHQAAAEYHEHQAASYRSRGQHGFASGHQNLANLHEAAASAFNANNVREGSRLAGKTQRKA